MYLNAVGLFTVAQNEDLLSNNSVTRNILNIIMNNGPKIKSTNELKKKALNIKQWDPQNYTKNKLLC